MRYLEWLSESSKKTWDSSSPGHYNFEVGLVSLISGQSQSTLSTQSIHTLSTEVYFTKIEQPTTTYPSSPMVRLTKEITLSFHSIRQFIVFYTCSCELCHQESFKGKRALPTKEFVVRFFIACATYSSSQVGSD